MEIDMQLAADLLGLELLCFRLVFRLILFYSGINRVCKIIEIWICTDVTVRNFFF